MNITRDNYEEFLMLYADNELGAAEKLAVEQFLAVNIDLKAELVMFQQFKAAPDEAIVFSNKAALMKHLPELTITSFNCESFFVLYADNELTNEEKTIVENFVYRHPQLQPAFELITQVKMAADTNIVFVNKAVLYRKEADDKVVPVYWWRMAAAAAVILFISGLVWFGKEKNTGIGVMAKNIQKGQPVQIHLPQATDTTGGHPGKKEKGTAQAIAGTNLVKQVKSINVPAYAVNDKNETASASKKLPVQKEPAIKQEVAVIQPAVSNVIVMPVQEPATEKALVATAAKHITDEQVIILTPDEDNKNKASFVSLNNDDNVEVLNTSVNTKTSLRGFFRKASRLITKKTNGNEEGNHKGILIGGFEIAVR